MNEPDVIQLGVDPVRFGQSFVGSDAFRALFQEGMELIEDTAAYLDGPGREESRHLERQISLVYASESMRLTTRLMQVASWLLLQRAVAEGEISPDQAQTEKNRVRLNSSETTTSVDEYEALPERLRELMGLATRLHARILHLERLIAEAGSAPRPAAANPIAAQLGMLEKAFGPTE
ncbi:regulator of CtrA degradation [Microvirga lupini]|uniref:Regulator of CtrA degradation n=1 Tax=Microvirga lupini TaxID=420324 RepID=A0A7W4VQD9_9HYPH|nr:regulator of CtrA degradation [Microvirga lupini]